MGKKIPMMSAKLQQFLSQHQEPSIEVRFIQGGLFAWFVQRFSQFFMRRVAVTVFFSIRYFLLAYAFVWFSWSDLIFFTSIAALMVGFHFGALESYRKLAQSKASIPPYDLRMHLAMARVMTWVVAMFFVIYFLIVSRHGFVKGYHVNVFDLARFLVVVRGISQVFRNLDVAYQSKNGMQPIALRWLWLMEFVLLAFFVCMVLFAGHGPGVLGWILFIEAVFVELVMWRWLYFRQQVRIRYRARLKDFGLFFLFLKNKAVEFLFDTTSGVFLYAERFILAALMYRVILRSPVVYFIVLPMTVLIWRSPHYFARYFRSHQSMLRRKIGLSILAIVFLTELAMGILIFLIFQNIPMQRFAQPEKIVCIIVLLGPASAIFAYVWYANILSEIVGQLRKIFGYKSLYVEFTKNVPTDLPSGALPNYGKVYLFWVRRSKMMKLKNRLFAMSLGNICFYENNPILKNKPIEHNDELKKIPVGSMMMRKYILNTEDAEYALRKIKKCMQDGRSRSWSRNGYQFRFGLSSFNWPMISVKKNI